MPPRLSGFDREQFFTRTSSGVAAIRDQFRSDHRLPASLMHFFMRVADRPLDGFNVLPRNLLRHTAQVLAIAPPSIASLRSIYKRRQTLSKHQLWAKTYLGLREMEIDDEAALTSILLAQASNASHADDLVQSASHWLFTQRILIPGARRIRDWARDAFATVEAQILSAVNTAVPPAAAQKVIEAAYSARPGPDTTQLGWLKTPSKRQGPSTLSETLDKVRYLKGLGTHEWNLSAVSLAKQQAYARQVQARRPLKTRELKSTRQLIELICFLRVTLSTDHGTQVSDGPILRGRVSCDLGAAERLPLPIIDGREVSWTSSAAEWLPPAAGRSGWGVPPGAPRAEPARHGQAQTSASWHRRQWSLHGARVSQRALTESLPRAGDARR